MMRGALLFLIGLTAVAAPPEDSTFQLEANDYRWVPLRIRQPPVRVEAVFEVSNGEGTVHAELIPESAFRAMQRGQPHQALAATADGTSGTLRYLIEDPGLYRVVVTNRNAGKPAIVIWKVSTDLHPTPEATELSPKRRLVTILVSFLLFFAMVGYSGWKLRKSAQA